MQKQRRVDIAAGFQPVNELENALIDAREKRIAIIDFLRKMLDADVHVPSANEVQADGSGFQPVLFDTQRGTLIAVFTARDRVGTVHKDVRFCWTMKGQQFFASLAPGFGAVVNPGFDIGFEIPPEGVAELRAELANC